LADNVFSKGFFLASMCVWQTHRKPILTDLVLERDGFLPNITLEQKIILVVHDLILTKHCILFIKKRENVLTLF
jgi:hypothetical protein